MQHDQPNAYDQVSYASRAFPQTHPDRLATLAALFGLQPPPVAKCRVLELGCGDGSNLIPMAYGLPASHFVGIDLAATPIARGQASISTLGLQNIALRQLDILDIDRSIGEFDYIIAHGLYAWVPPAVQNKILAICRDHLTPNGIAYISYNTYPGGHLRDMVRGMMRFHVQQVGSSGEEVSEARALLEFLANAQPAAEVYGKLLQIELQRITSSSEGYVYHDDLAAINSPVYFHEFIARASEYALQYLAEADYFEMQDMAFAPAVAQALRHVAAGERILHEQYADFLKCRKFRQTLLCHHAHKLSPITDISAFSLTSSVNTTATPGQLRSATEVEFRDQGGQSLTTNQPLLKAALHCLGQAWPKAIAFGELLTCAQASASIRPTSDAKALLSEMLLRVYGRNMVTLHVHPPSFVIRCGERPRASALARLQAAERSMVTNLRQENVELTGALAGKLLQLLDGTRTREELLIELAHYLGVEHVTPVAGGLPASVATELDRKLTELATLALIEA